MRRKGRLMEKEGLNLKGKIDWRRLAARLEKEFPGRPVLGVPLADHTSWKVGGPAALMYCPLSAEDCAGVFALCHKEGIPLLILGSGTNLLVADEGVDALVLNMNGLREISWQHRQVKASAGASLAQVAAMAGQRDLRGLEFAIGIPGSVGGAVLMNAGAYGCQMSDVVKAVEIMEHSGRRLRLSSGELEYRYRKSRLQDESWLVLEAELELTAGDGEEIRETMKRYLESRRAKQPLELPNGGSVFKNPAGQGAGRFIDRAGLKGLTIGRAQVSPKHANFIVNLGGARASDIRELIGRVRATVAELYGVELEREVIYWGF